MNEVLSVGICLFLTLMNLCMVWMNIKLLTENVKHRLLEK